MTIHESMKYGVNEGMITNTEYVDTYVEEEYPPDVKDLERKEEFFLAQFATAFDCLLVEASEEKLRTIFLLARIGKGLRAQRIIHHSSTQDLEKLPDASVAYAIESEDGGFSIMFNYSTEDGERVFNWKEIE